MDNIRINSVGIYHPENKVSNDFYIEHFFKQDKDIRRLLEAYGRKTRYVINNKDENNITMAIKACENALNKAYLKGEDIDLIIFSSIIPQYTMPPQAIMIHNAIKGKKDCMVLDTNVNCAGMIVAVDNAVRILKTNNNFKKALIVGSDCWSRHCSTNDELTYPIFGDCACAVILEKTDKDSDFLGSHSLTNSDNWDMVKYPSCGMTNIYEDINPHEKMINWTPFDGSFSVKEAKLSINKLLDDYHLSLDNIDLYCISQFALGMRDGFLEEFSVTPDKVPYIGDKYGYTGCTSPFLALYESIESGKLKRGDNVILWSIGTFWSTCSLLLRY
ncbi:ketoacyl-ACP synthase III [Clostridium sp. AL.422]|uniref:ketoacyl-ACP synthase III n=1 Tax=Clostridium TaxID=1485 RepID=UPI00293DA72C|nr:MULTISPECIES: ketoacyl-ACP synthase III [unclassified Clostridium]MDV4150059.1 ketoacyl-ACP synthase III [Clostridium sp. AL.422]